MPLFCYAIKMKLANPSTSNSGFAKRVLIFLIGSVFLMAAVHLLLQYLNLDVYKELNGRIYELSNRVDFDDEVSVPTWFSQALFLAIAGSSFLIAYMHKIPDARRLWGFLGFIGLLLSIDEVSALHELLLQTVHLLLFGETGPTIINNAWVAFLPLILIAAMIIFWQMLKYVPRRTILICALGGTVFLAGAIFIDILTNSNLQNNFYNKGILPAIEESLELIGMSIILYALLSYIEQTYSDKLKSSLERLRA